MSGISHLLQLRGHEQSNRKYTRSLIGWIIVQIVSVVCPSSVGPLTIYFVFEQQIQAIGTNNFQYVRVPAFIEAMPNPDCVLRAGILNSMISQFCHSTSEMWDIPHQSSPDGGSTQQLALRNLLQRASCLMQEI
jgi:hypothetical protein